MLKWEPANVGDEFALDDGEQCPIPPLIIASNILVLEPACPPSQSLSRSRRSDRKTTTLIIQAVSYQCEHSSNAPSSPKTSRRVFL